MKRKNILRISLFVSMAASLLVGRSSMAQDKPITISGKVTSFEESFPLEGVSVSIKDRKLATGTMPDGVFSLEVQQTDRYLVFSLPGYISETVELKTDKSRFYEVVLRRGNLAMHDGEYQAPLSPGAVSPASLVSIFFK
jgi:hypothetical protein